MRKDKPLTAIQLENLKETIAELQKPIELAELLVEVNEFFERHPTRDCRDIVVAYVALMKEVHLDIRQECEDEIKAKLYEWAIAKILRGCAGGLPQWYKEQLLKQSFEAPNLSEEI